MTAPIRLPNGWKPREYQRPLWEYLAGGGRHALVVAHRRWGKDDVALHHTACAAHERVANYIHMLPEYEQARKAIWEATNPHTGKRRIDEAFPDELRAATRNDEMFIRFKNGSSWQVAGSDSYNKIVGASYAGITYSEYAISNPSAQDFFTPMLVENKGWELLITTPRGRNHCYKMHEFAKKQMAMGRDWYTELSTASRTGALDAEYLLSEMDRLQGMHGEDMGRALYLQEYECSFDAAIPGSIFGDTIRVMEGQGRFGAVPVDPALPLYTGWDLGRTDDTAIWWAQVFAGELRVVAYHASNFKDVPYYAGVLAEMREKLSERAQGRVEYGVNFLPHDARPRTLASSRSILQQLDDANREMGGKLGTFQIAPRLDKQEQIQAGRASLKKAWIDETQCEKGLEALKNYQREWDDDNKVFKDSPKHDWCSHPADAWLTLSVAWKVGRIPRGESAVQGRSDGRSIGPGVTFGERKAEHLRKRKLEREGMWS